MLPLLKLTDCQHGDNITIGKGPKPIDSRCLTDLHVHTRRARCGRNWTALPGKNPHFGLWLFWSCKKLPVWPGGSGCVKVCAGTADSFPLEDPLVLSRLPLQPHCILADNKLLRWRTFSKFFRQKVSQIQCIPPQFGRIVKLVVDKLNQTIKFRPRLQNNQLSWQAWWSHWRLRKWCEASTFAGILSLFGEKCRHQFHSTDN